MYDRAKLRDALKARNMTNEALRAGRQAAYGGGLPPKRKCEWISMVCVQVWDWIWTWTTLLSEWPPPSHRKGSTKGNEFLPGLGERTEVIR